MRETFHEPSREPHFHYQEIDVGQIKEIPQKDASYGMELSALGQREISSAWSQLFTGKTGDTISLLRDFQVGRIALTHIPRRIRVGVHYFALQVLRVC